MAIELKHTTQASGTDAGNGEIRKAQWNENHTLTMATSRLLGRSSANTGAVEEISVGSGLSLSGGSIDAAATVLKSSTSTNLTVGFTASGYNAGTQSSGTFTPNPANGALQYAVNGGAHTLAPPSTGSGNAVSVVVQYTNNGSAGTITTSGFTKVTGDSFTTTNGHDFMCYMTVINGFSHLNVVALQ